MSVASRSVFTKLLFVIIPAALGFLLSFFFFPRETKNELVFSKSVCDYILNQTDLKPVTIFEGEPDKIDFSTIPSLNNFYTTTSKQAAEGPNFAGHFTFIRWGCGTDCISYTIIDAITGKSVLSSYETVEGLSPTFDINSRLLIFNPKENFEKLKGQKMEDIIGDKDYYEARKGRQYYELKEEENGYTWLHHLCTENILDGIYSH